MSEQLDAQLQRRQLSPDSVTRRLADYEARLGGLQADYSFLRSEFDRLAPQLSALEYRFERLRDRVGDDVADDGAALRQAQLEHERARIRLELASHYEERLRRLEGGAHA
ncbi:hypothetical protein [Microbacterium lacus]